MESSGSGSPIVSLIYLAVMVLSVAGGWKMLSKAGQPGWGIIIPFYNLYLILKVAGRPGWWLVLMLIPLVNFIIGIIVCIDLAKAFGKGAGFGIGLLFLGFIFMPILGFGSATYQGAGAAPQTAAAA